jgi:monoamine oxidase
MRVSSRRHFLKAGAAATILAPGWSHASEPDVAIVGAGAAGLAAADTLRQAGKSVVILEAMGRIGGRAFTDSRFFGAPFDVGCAWLHRADRNPFVSRARSYGYTLQTHDYDLDRIYLYNREATDAQVAAMNAEEEKLEAAIRSAARTRDVSAAAVVDMNDPWAETAANYLGPLDWGADFEDISVQDYESGEDLDPNMLCKEGYGAIIKRFGEGAPVRLATPVRLVRHGGAGVQLETDAGVVKAKKAIITCSVGVLAAEAIRFDPLLPVWKREAFDDVRMGLLTKIPLQVNARFGLKAFEDIYLERIGRRDFYFLCFPFDYPLMIGFVGGNLAWEMAAQGQAAGVDYATNALVDLFGANARKAVVKGMMTDWASNKWTKGAYSAAKPGKFSARAKLATPIDEKIFFAGEALGGALVQTAGGAFNAGVAAAQACLRALA